MTTRLPELQILEARPDWITCSAPKDHDGQRLWGFAMQELEHEHAAGERLSSWGWHGYKGYQCGDIRTGWGENGAIAVVSQDSAARCASTLARLASHWSRVDYCITAWSADATFNFSDYYWNTWKWKAEPQKSPTELSFFQNLRGGSTLYVGDRASAFFLRVYDKHAESPEEYADGCWRWEVELKREASELQQSRWREGPVKSKDVTNFVASKCATYGMRVPFSYEQVPTPSGRVYRRRDVDRTLSWLERQVSKSVEFAVEQRGREEVRRSLGI